MPICRGWVVLVSRTGSLPVACINTIQATREDSIQATKIVTQEVARPRKWQDPGSKDSYPGSSKHGNQWAIYILAVAILFFDTAKNASIFGWHLPILFSILWLYRKHLQRFVPAYLWRDLHIDPPLITPPPPIITHGPITPPRPITGVHLSSRINHIYCICFVHVSVPM